jgi:uncharacterized protein (TIGR02246 family)
MKIAAMALVGSIAFVSAGSTTAFAQTKDPAMDKLAADWAAAFAKGDAKALAGLYTENALRVTPEAGKVIGRVAIEKEFAANFAGPWYGAKITINPGSTQAVNADVAVNEGTYQVTGVVVDGKPVPPLKGSYVNTVVKKGGAWILASNTAIPEPAAAK